MNLKMQAFIREYCRDLNATKAAARAGYSMRTAYSTGSRLLKDREVQAAIKARVERRMERVDIKADEVVRELRKIAFTDLSGVLEVKNSRLFIRDTAVLSEDQWACIAEMAPTENGIRVKLHDKQKALEMLGRHMGMFTDKLEHGGEMKIAHTMSDEELARIAAGKEKP